MSIRLPTDNVGLMINLKPYRSVEQGFRSNKTVGSQPISWSPEIQFAILDHFQKCQRPFRRNNDPPFPEPLRSEIIRFQVSLDAYLESDNPILTSEFLIQGVSSGYKFAKYLKDLRTSCIHHTFYAKTLDENDDLRDMPKYFLKDIGQIFNYNYLINWEEPDPEDYLYGWEPYSIDKGVLSELKEELEDLCDLVPNPEIIDPVTILSELSGSRNIDPTTQKKSTNWKIKDKTNKFGKNIGTCHRTVLQLGPSNVRDTVIISSNSLNTVKFIDKQVQKILDELDESFQHSDPHKIEEKLQLMKKNRFFLMRDIQKEGITKPRELLKLTLEVLKSKFPKCKAFEFSDFYDDFNLLVDNKLKYPIRGHGLGMANSLTTFLQIAIFNLVLKYADCETYQFESECSALALNDDFLVGFGNSEDFEAYNYAEDIIFPKLGLLRHRKKSFYSEDCFVIAERYYHMNLESIEKKESYHRREILNCFACTNIVQAKQQTSSCVTYANIDIARSYLEEIVSFWGYEFFPEEINYPYMFGGWFTLNMGGVNFDLVELERLPFGNKIIRAYNACRYDSIKIRWKNKRKFVSPMIKILKPFRIPEEFYSYLDIGTYGDMYSKFFRIKESQNYEKIWDNLLLKRQRTFADFSKCNFGYETFLEIVVNDHPLKTFYPCLEMIKSYQKGTYTEGYLKDIYLSSNPKLALLSLYNEYIITEDLKEDFSIFYTKKDSLTKTTNPDLHQKIKGSIYTNVTSEFAFPPLFGYYDSDEILDLYESYLNPQSLARVSSMIVVNKIPILKEKYRSPLIKKKSNVFGRFLLPTEQLLLQKCKRTLIKDIITASCEEGFSIEEILSEIEEHFNKPDEIIYPEEEVTTGKDVILEDFWTWRSNREPISYPFDVIFEMADSAITIESFRFFSGFNGGNKYQEPPNVLERRIKSNMRFGSNYKLESEVNIAYSIFLKWKDKAQAPKDEEIGEDLDVLFS